MRHPRPPGFSAAAVLLLTCALSAASSPSLQAAGTPDKARAESALSQGVNAWNAEHFEGALTQFEEAVRFDPDDGIARYWLGMTRLRLGDAAGAADEMETALRSRLPETVDRARVQADLGAAHLEAGHPAAALESLDDSLAAHPNDPAALYMRGVALAGLGKVDEGRAQAERARSLDPTLPDLPERTLAPGGRGETVASGPLPFWEIRLGASYGSDSNPNLLNEELNQVFDPNTGHRLDASDTAASGDLRVEIHPFYDRAGWSLGLRLDAYQSAHGDFEFLDLTEGRGVAQLAWGEDPLGYVTGPMGYTRVPVGSSRASFLVQAGRSFLHLDSEAFLRTYEGGFAAMIHEGRTTATQIELSYRGLSYSGNPAISSFDNRDLSGHESTLKASQYLFGGRHDRYVRLGLLAGESDRDEAFFDASILEASLEASFPLHRRLSLHLAGSSRRDDFDEALAGESHDENTTQVSTALVWVVANHLYLTLRGSYVDRKVDPEPLRTILEYDRTVASLGLTWYH